MSILISPSRGQAFSSCGTSSLCVSGVSASSSAVCLVWKPCCSWMKPIAAVAPGLRIMDNINMGSNPNNLPDMRMRGGANMDLNAQATVDLNSASNDVLAVQGEYETYANQPLLIMDGFEISIQTLADRKSVV